MSHTPHRCNSLTPLPDLSKWDTSKVTNINYMFYRCNSLISLPDLTELKKVKDKNSMTDENINNLNI